jgi:hypothetical protein
MKSTSRNPKARGELTEIRFLLAAALCGLIVCKPWGESQPFDFVVTLKGSRRFYRIQVKSTSHQRRHAYRVSVTKGGRRCYTAREVDFVACYVVPTNTWYIIPVRLLTERKLISVYPQKSGSRGMFEPFCNRWQLLSR